VAMSIWAFRNQIVFHSFDNMSSVFLHMFPSFITTNIRLVTIP
jgi:hypothetical protein